MAKLILYASELSPATRATMLVIKALGLEVEIRALNVFNGDQFKPDFLKLNPTHTLPTLDDNGLILWDSHAINTYLVAKYGKDLTEQLYPVDIIQRAKIDQFLHLDGSTLFPRFFAIIRELFFQKQTDVSADALSRGLEALSFLDKSLENSEYLVGDRYTLADFSCVTVAISLLRLLPHEGKYKNVAAWINRLEQLPYYDEVNGKKLDLLEKSVRDALAANKA